MQKQKLQHYPRKRDVNINVFRLLKQWLVIKHTVVPSYTLHTDVKYILSHHPRCHPRQ